VREGTFQRRSFQDFRACPLNPWVDIQNPGMAPGKCLLPLYPKNVLKKCGTEMQITYFHILSLSLVRQSQQIGNKGVCYTVALPFILKSILRQKKNYGKLKYFTMQNYNLQKIL